MTRFFWCSCSALIGQNFTTDTDPADSSKIIAAPYNAANSSGSNDGPTEMRVKVLALDAIGK